MNKLDQLYNKLELASEHLAGYPINTKFDYSELYKFLKFPVNNVGDPFDDNLYSGNTHEVERDVIDWFAKLFNANDNYWGYVTNGGTEGNMCGLYLAREAWPTGIVYMSEDTHYSMMKAVHLLRMDHIIVKSGEDGEFDYDDFDRTIHLHRDRPVIVVANMGTTMKSGFDNIPKIKSVLKKHAIRRSYIHVDAALYGIILPFLEMKNKPVFDFSVGVDSISVSGHKFIGLPIPAGVIVAKRQYVERVKTAIEYIGAHDTTITGSRNGITPLLIWKAITDNGHEGFKKLVADCYRNTDYLVSKLENNHWYARKPCSTTVIIDRPSDDLVRKWQMAVADDISHIIVMPHLTQDKIDELVKELDQDK